MNKKTNFRTILILAFVLLLGSYQNIAQNVGIGAESFTPDHSAGLEVKFTDKGFLLPRLTTEQRNSIDTPAQGLQIFNTTTICLEIFTGTHWMKIVCGCTESPVFSDSIQGDNEFCENAQFVQFSIEGVSNYNKLKWFVPEDAIIISGHNSENIIVNFGKISGNLCIEATNDCGTDSICMFIDLLSSPEMPAQIYGQINPGFGSTGIQYSIETTENFLSYIWTVPPGASIVSGQGTESIVVNFDNISGDICVKAVGECGDSEFKCMPVQLVNKSINLASSQSQYLSGSASGLPGGNSPRTIEAWIKRSSINSTVFIVDYGSWSNGMEFGLTIRDDGSAWVDIYNGLVWGPQTNMQANKWHHFAVTYANGIIKWYVDGQFIGSANHSFNTGNSGMRIGARYFNTPGGYFNGLIDDVRIWNTERTAAEICSYMSVGSIIGNEPNLVRYWTFDNVLKDEVTNTDLSTHNGYSFSGLESNEECEPCILPPVEDSIILTENTITWTWTSVDGAEGYKYNTQNNYSTATDNGLNTTFVQNGTFCGEQTYELYVWAYKDCGGSLHARFDVFAEEACPWLCGDILTDNRDNKNYETIQIGLQCWMKQNLNYETSNSACYANNNSNCNIYGRLYSWAEVMNSSSSSSTNPSNVQGICPEGWHLPSDNEWKQLEIFLGMSQAQADAQDYRGSNQGSQIKSSTGWISGNGTNSSGFTALPGGTNPISDWSDAHIGRSGFWWTSTESSDTHAWYRRLWEGSSGINRYPAGKNSGYSIRCLKN